MIFLIVKNLSKSANGIPFKYHSIPFNAVQYRSVPLNTIEDIRGKFVGLNDTLNGKK